MKRGGLWICSAAIVLLVLCTGTVPEVQAQSKWNAVRARLLELIPTETLIVYSPARTLHRVTVFTDITCIYCRRLHRDIARLNELGIEVRYAAFPRRHEQRPEAYRQMISVWCAPDRRKAMNEAKTRRRVTEADCDHPVDLHIETGKRMGVRATPTFVTDDGRLMRGYSSHRKLARRIVRG